MNWLLTALHLLREIILPRAPQPATVPGITGIPVSTVGGVVLQPRITVAEIHRLLRAMFPQLGSALAWAEVLVPHMLARGIDTPVRVAAFLAQVGHESGRFTQLVESLNYAADRLVAVFGRDRISAEQAAAHGRTAKQVAQQKAIANIVYGGAWGRTNLGNTEPGDGFAFRGRGLIQLTGRANYARCAAAFGMSVNDLPAYLQTIEGAARAACWFWEDKGCNALADSGDFQALTRRINGGLKGLTEREDLYAAARLAQDSAMA